MSNQLTIQDKCLLHLKLNDSRTVKYLLQKDGLISRITDEDLENNSDLPLISLTNDDYYLRVEEKISDKKAGSLLVLQADAPVKHKLINDSLHHYIYATSSTRLELTNETLKLRVYSLMNLLNYTLNKHGKSPDIMGFLLGSKHDLLILVAINESGKLETAIQADCTDLQEAIRSFAISVKLHDDFVPAIYDQEDFFHALQVCQPYPNYEVIYGFPENKVWSTAIAASLAGFIIIGSTWAIQDKEIKDLTSEISQLQSNMDESNRHISEVIATHIPDIVNRSSINFVEFFDHAHTLWVPKTYLESEISKEGETHTVHLPIDQQSKLTFPDVSTFYQVQLPVNCETGNTNIKAMLNEITTEYHCKNPNSIVSVFGL